MSDTVQQAEAEVARRLAAALEPDSPNEMTATDVRDWAIEYLSAYDDDLSRFPQLVGESHWDLMMMDARSEDALFVVLVFRTDSVEFFCGCGDAFDIKQFSESDFPENVEQMFSEMARRFLIKEGTFRLPREQAEMWLGRGW